MENQDNAESIVNKMLDDIGANAPKQEVTAAEKVVEKPTVAEPTVAESTVAETTVVEATAAEPAIVEPVVAETVVTGPTETSIVEETVKELEAAKTVEETTVKTDVVVETVAESEAVSEIVAEAKAVEKVAAKPVETVPATEAADSAEAASDAEEPAEEKPAMSKSNKIKIGIIIAGLTFILIAAIYAAAVAGGKTNKIPVATPEVIEEAEPEEKEPEPTKALPTIAVEDEEEETAQDSMIAIMLGNRRYDECVYADGGVVIVKKGDFYGAMDYEGKEIAPVKYAEIIQRPTEGGRFILANSKVESVTEEKDGTTLSYEKTITTYTLYDNAGHKVFEGNQQIYTSDDVYMIGIEDSDNPRNNRVEYYRYDGKNKAFMVIYVKDSFSMTGFKDGKTVVYGFTAVPTEDQDTNPTNLVCGIMDEHGKVSWFATAPGISEFSAEVEKWKEENKTIKTTTAKKKKKQKEMVTTFDEDGNEILVSEDELDENDEDADTDEETEEIDEEEYEEELTDEELEQIEEEADLSSGPQFHMDGILNAPSQGYFVVKDLYDVNDPYSFYDTKGLWLADLDTAYMKGDAKKGFVTGNFNNGSVSVSKFISGGQLLYNYGSMMVLDIDKRAVLIDVSKAKGMKSDSIDNKIVVAKYDDIIISDSEYWMFRDGDKCGYIDHKGNSQKVTFEDATPFVNGKALVVKNGKAIIIDESFAELEEVGEASSVDIAGDLIMILRDGVTKNYILKENRDNPLGVKEEAAQEDPKAVTPTPEADTKSTSKKKK